MLSVLYRFYTYLYYRLYRWNLRTWGEGDFPHINAMIGASFLIFLNIFSILALFEALSRIDVINVSTSKAIAIILLLIAYCIGYYAFLYRQKYRQFGEVFADETPRRQVVNALLLWLYALGSFGVLLIIGQL